VKSIELRQKKATLVANARESIDRADEEKRDLTAEEQNSWNAYMADVEKLDAQITMIEKQEALERDLALPTSTPELPGGEGRANPAAEKVNRAWDAYLRSGAVQPEVRALQADADTQGGYYVPPQQFVNKLIKAIDNVTYMRQWGTPNPVASAASLGVPTLEADPADADWTSELLIGGTDSTMAFGKRELTPKPLAKLLKVSNKLLRLTPDVESLVIQRLAYKFQVSFEKAGMTGSGANQPLGVFTASADGIPTSRDVSTGNTTTSIQTDGLLEAKYSLKAGYWPKARWIFHRDAIKQIAKLQNDAGDYIWDPNAIRVGEPDRLMGFPVFASEYAPNTFTTGQYVGMLGDFSFWWYADALDFAIQRLNELYAATNQVGFIGRLESDGMPVLGEAFARVKLA
jgi:HK97 family phage major capsid protein